MYAWSLGRPACLNDNDLSRSSVQRHGNATCFQPDRCRNDEIAQSVLKPADEPGGSRRLRPSAIPFFRWKDIAGSLLSHDGPRDRRHRHMVWLYVFCKFPQRALYIHVAGRAQLPRKSNGVRWNRRRANSRYVSAFKSIVQSRRRSRTPRAEVAAVSRGRWNILYVCRCSFLRYVAAASLKKTSPPRLTCNHNGPAQAHCCLTDEQDQNATATRGRKAS